MAIRATGGLAAAWMETQSKNAVTKLLNEDLKGFCLRACRLAWGLQGVNLNAKIEWNNIPDRFKHENPREAPVGALHFWTGSTHGHVALQSKYKGIVWSTDQPASGYIGLVHGAFIGGKSGTHSTPNWHLQYLGWSSYLEGKDLTSRLARTSAGLFIPAADWPGDWPNDRPQDPKHPD